MSNDGTGFALGATAIIVRIVAWILIGIGTFQWIGVDSFGSAILWLIVWHIATTIVHFILLGIAALLLDR